MDQGTGSDPLTKQLTINSQYHGERLPRSPFSFATTQRKDFQINIWWIEKNTVSLQREIEIINLMAKDNTAYWIDIAEYDLETAKALMNSKRWLYVGFMCHQVIEKALKAYWCATKPEDPPYTHNLLNLIQSSNLIKEISAEQKSFVQSIMPLNIEARYPEYKDRLLRQLSPEVCEQIINDTTTFLLWIKSKLLK